MHCPIDSKPNNILLEPIYKNLLKRSLCVYVNNTKKKGTDSWKRQKKSLWQKKEHPPWCHGYSSRRLQKNLSPPTICPRGFAIQAWSVINRNKRCVLCSLYLSLSSGCIDWKLNNEIVKRKKNGLLKRSYNYLWLVVSVNCFFFWMKGVLFIFLLRLYWWRKKSVWKSVLCWHKFHLL